MVATTVFVEVFITVSVLSPLSATYNRLWSGLSASPAGPVPTWNVVTTLLLVKSTATMLLTRELVTYATGVKFDPGAEKAITTVGDMINMIRPDMKTADRWHNTFLKVISIIISSWNANAFGLGTGGC